MSLAPLVVLASPVRAALPNGVAAGDATQTSAVLWAHSTTIGDVTFQISADPGFSGILDTQVIAVTDPTLPVKVQANALLPGTKYYYRATDAVSATANGTFRTAAASGSAAPLSFGVSGDWRGELAPYPAISNAPGMNLDFFVKLGDTVYADVPSPALATPASSLADFRAKENEIYSAHLGANSWAALQQSTAVLSMLDDHEVTNDFAGGAPPASDPRFDNTGSFINQTQLYANGVQAFAEYNPIQSHVYNTPGQPLTDGRPKFYRAASYGSTAAVMLLDARSFRSQELAPIANPLDSTQVSDFVQRSFDIDPVTHLPTPPRTMLGLPQLADLKSDLLAAQAAGTTWKLVMIPEPIQNLGPAGAQDRYEGYATERSDLLRFIHDNAIHNVVFIAADLHGTLVNNLTYQDAPGGPQIPTDAFEVVTGAVAYDKPFGPTLLDLAATTPIFPGFSALDFFLNSVGVANRAAFDALPRQQRDTLTKTFISTQLSSLGYSPLGLEDSGLNATLLQGDYVAINTYNWTKFDIDPLTQQLMVTTYGIDPYNLAQLTADPSAILTRTPQIVSQFSVTPFAVNPVPEPATLTVFLLAAALLPRRPLRR